MTKQCLKLTHMITIVKMTSRHLKTILLHIWELPYAIQNYVLTDNGPQFVSKMFSTFRISLGLKKLRAVCYHLQKNGEVVQCSYTMVARLVFMFPNIGRLGTRLYSDFTYAKELQKHNMTGMSLSL